MGKTWFEGSNDINCNIQEMQSSFEKIGELYTNVVSLMPGLTSVELVKEGSDFVTIKTNEGEMKRTNITKKVEAHSLILEFDEEYKAGKMVTAKSHFVDEFVSNSTGVNHKMVISDVKAPGFLGFFYRSFGSSSIGNALLKSYKTYFESKESD